MIFGAMNGRPVFEAKGYKGPVIDHSELWFDFFVSLPYGYSDIIKDFLIGNFWFNLSF